MLSKLKFKLYINLCFSSWRLVYTNKKPPSADANPANHWGLAISWFTTKGLIAGTIFGNEIASNDQINLNSLKISILLSPSLPLPIPPCLGRRAAKARVAKGGIRGREGGQFDVNQK